jgi:hypothetical protein
MAAMQPYAQLVGTVKIYLAPYGEAEPNINSVPGANWIELGATEGEQSIEEAGDLTKFYDNDHQGPVKATLPQEDIMVNFTLVDMTLEKVARIKGNVSAVVSTTMNGVNVKQLPFKRGATPTEYALLWRGEADSPYGMLPGQNYFPRGVFNGAGTRTRAKDARQAVESQFHVLEDDNQSEGKRMGWGTVQY